MPDDEARSSIYAGGLPYELTEGDIVCVFSQYGEIFEISLSRDRETGKSRGFCFIKYEDPRSCELAVDNLHGASIVGRKIKVSYANNTNAVKATRPTIVAPQVVDSTPRDGGQNLKETESYRSIKHRDNFSPPHSRGDRHNSSRDRSLSPPHRYREPRSRHKDDSPPSKPPDRHRSSRHKRDRSSSHSRTHHRSSRHKRDRSPSHSRRHHSSRKKDDRSSHSRSHHRSSKRSHDSRDRSPKSETGRKRR